MSEKKEEIKVTELDKKIIKVIDDFNDKKGLKGEKAIKGNFENSTISFLHGNGVSGKLDRAYLKSLKEDKLKNIITQQLITITS